MSHPLDATALLVSTLAATLAAIPAQAWGQSAPADPQQLQRVEITGSSIKRIDAETALPVQIITRDQIQKSGAANVEQLLLTVPSLASSGSLTASSAAGATTGGISSVSLHGLTSQRTLVLLNGRRISPYGIGFTGDAVSIDVNSIPLAAIERVEVLKDGASAIYGSDAIAGVVNFILRQDFKGAELTAEYGNTTRGGADFKRGSGVFGFGDLATDRYNVMLTASYQKEGSLFGRDRDFAKTSINGFNDTSSGNTFPANIAAVDGSFGSRNPTAPACPGPYAVFDPAISTKACRFDVAPLVSLVPAAERTSVFGSARYAVTPDLQAYLEASYSRNATRTIFQPVPISDAFNLPSNNPLFGVDPYNGFSTIILKTSSVYYPTAYVQGITGGPTPDLLVRYRSQTGNRDVTDTSESPRLVAGIKGVAAGWDIDAAALYSENKLTEHDNGGWPQLTKILPLLNSGTVNFFGPNTPDVEAALQATNFNQDAFRIKTSITSLAARAARDVIALPAGPVGVAFGAEARKERYDFMSSPEIAHGDISGYGGNLASNKRARSVAAVFGEVNVPIAKGLEGDVAVRFDHYQGIGASTTPKASLRWQPAREILFRGSFGQGFRAPSLQDLYAPVTTGVTGQGATDSLRCPTTMDFIHDCSTQFPLANGGKTTLRPEKSNNLTLGAVFEPVSAVSINVDYFRVLLKDTIVNGVASAVILSDPIKYASFITRAAPDPAFPDLPGRIVSIDATNLNLGNSKLSGFDVEGKWRFATADYGRFTVDVTATYFNRFDSSLPDGSYMGGVDTTNTATGGLVPRLKTYSSIDWTFGPWNLTFAQSFQKGYNDIPGATNSDPRRVESFAIYDLQGTYTASKAWRFTLGARNLLDRDPPYSNIGGQGPFQSGYDNTYADPRGRFVYARVTYSIQ
jgi:iron complex outermembrane receptor protein